MDPEIRSCCLSLKCLGNLFHPAHVAGRTMHFFHLWMTASGVYRNDAFSHQRYNVSGYSAEHSLSMVDSRRTSSSKLCMAGMHVMNAVDFLGGP